MSPKQYLLASDFDQTLSFNDSGILLSEMLGLTGFAEKCAGLSSMHLVHQGAELAYLLLHDPEYRRVRREDLQEVGRRIRLKQNIGALPRLLQSLENVQFTFCVISAAPEEVIRSALEGVVSPSGSTAPGFAMTRAREKSNPSSGYRQGTARWPCSRSSGLSSD